MIRFQRIGRKNDPAFRIVVLEKTSGPKAGKYVDLVGTYNPKTKATTLQADRIKDWTSKGAQISPSLMNLLISQGVYEGAKTAVVSKKNLEKNKAKSEAAVQAPAPEAVADVEAPSEEAIEAEVAADEAAETPAEETPTAPAEEEASAEPTTEETPAEVSA